MVNIDKRKNNSKDKGIVSAHVKYKYVILCSIKCLKMCLRVWRSAMLKGFVLAMLCMMPGIMSVAPQDGLSTHQTVYVQETNQVLEDNIYIYNSIEDVQRDITLQVDMYVETLGYYTAYDGGSGVYIVQDTGEIFDVVLDNGLYAHLLVEDEINIKQFGAIGDGITDDTEAIQMACDAGYPVVIPYTEESFLISRRISLSHSIRFEGNIRMTVNNGESGAYGCLLVEDYRGEEPLYISNPLLDGSRDTSIAYFTNDMEYAHGIRIIGSQNVYVVGGNIAAMQGDGIAIGASDNYAYSENIYVDGTVIESCFRNSISIISGKSILIENINAISQNGYRNILIEATGKVGDVLEGIYIDGCTLYGGCETAVLDICSNIKIKDVTICNTYIDIQGTKTTCGIRHSNANGYDYIPEKVIVSNTNIISDNLYVNKQNLIKADEIIVDNLNIEGHFKYIGFAGENIKINEFNIKNDSSVIYGCVNIKATERVEITNSCFNAKNSTQAYSGILNIEQCPDITVTDSSFLNNQNAIKVKNGPEKHPWVIESLVIIDNEFIGSLGYPTARAIVVGDYNTILNMDLENNIYENIKTKILIQNIDAL